MGWMVYILDARMEASILALPPTYFCASKPMKLAKARVILTVADPSDWFIRHFMKTELKLPNGKWR